MASARRWGIAALAAVVLLAGAALAAPFLVDLSTFRPQIQRAVRDAVAADLDFASMRLTILPRVGVRLLDVRLTPLDERWPEPILQLDRFDLGIAWLPLLRGSIELLGELDDVQLFIAQNQAGSNLDSLMAATDTSTPATDAENAAPLPDLPPLRLQSLTVAPMSIIYHDRATAQEARYALTNARISIFNVAPETQARLTALLPIALERSDIDAAGAIRIAAEATLPPLNALTAPVPFQADIDASELDLSMPGILRRSAGNDLRLTVSGRTDSAAELGIWLKPLRLSLEGVELAPQTSGLDELRLARVDAAMTLTDPTADLSAFARLDIDGKTGAVQFALPLTINIHGAASVSAISCIPCAFSVASRKGNIQLEQDGAPARIGLDLAAAGQAIFRDSVVERASAGLSVSSRFRDLTWRTPATEVSGDGSLEITGSTEILEDTPANLQVNILGDLTGVHLWQDGLLNKPAGESLVLHATMQAPTTTRVRGDYVLDTDGLALSGSFGLNNATQAFKSRLNAALRANSPASQWILVRPDLVTRTTIGIDVQATGELPRPDALRVDASLEGTVGNSDLDAQIWLMSLGSSTLDITVRSKRLDLDDLAGPSEDSAVENTATTTTSETEFCLDATDLATIRPIKLTLDADADTLVLDGSDYENAALDLVLAHGHLNLKRLELGLFGGRASGALTADLDTCPLPWTTRINLTNIQTEPLIAIYEPKHRKLLQAGADMTLDVAAVGTTSAAVRRSLTGVGTFLLHDGTLNTISLAQEIEQQVDTFVSGLSIVDAADDLFTTAEKLTANPVVQRSAAARSADPSRWRKKYETFRNFSIAGLLSVDKGIRDTAGELTFREGHLLISALNNSPSGRYDVDAAIAPDDRLSGAAEYIASPSVQQKMLSRSPYASLLFDDQGQFRLRMKLRGTLTEPSVGIDLTPLREGFRARSRQRVKEDVLAPLQQAAKDVVRGNLPDARKVIEQPKETVKKAAERAKNAGNSVREQGRQSVDKIGKKLFGR